MRRWVPLAGYVLLLVVLVATSVPRAIGDGREYEAAATNLAHFIKPSLTHAQRDVFGLDFSRLRGADGRQDTLHFWMYPAFAAMPVRFLAVWNAPIAVAFTAVNLALLLIAAYLANRQLEWATFTLVFASPILWWIDKVHTEVFTFSLIAIGILLAPARLIMASLALGFASAQNPPCAIVLASVIAAAWKAGASRSVLTVSALAGGAIAATHPLYYWFRLHRLFPLADATSARLSVQSFSAVVIDPNIGILFNDPALAVAAVVAGVAFVRSRPLRPRVWQGAAALSCACLLAVFGRVGNLNHGATPGISRYGLWLIPLAIPFLRDYRIGSVSKWCLGVAAIAGVVWSIAFYRPSLPESYDHPSRAALWIWTHYPSVNNPVPEIFAERLLHQEDIRPIAATPGCEKVLTYNGHWPDRCPVVLPAQCFLGTCYANRRRDGTYGFVQGVR